MKQKLLFMGSISRFGKAKQLIIYIPKTIKPLVEFQKQYKITLEEVVPIVKEKKDR